MPMSQEKRLILPRTNRVVPASLRSWLPVDLSHDGAKAQADRRVLATLGVPYLFLAKISLAGGPTRASIGVEYLFRPKYSG